MIKRGGLVRIEFKCRVIDIRPIRFGSRLHEKRWADPACRPGQLNKASKPGSTFLM